MLSFLVPIALALLTQTSCKDSGEVPGVDSTGTDPSITTTGGGLEWPYALPLIDGDEAQLGKLLALWVEGAPAGAEVTFYRSDVGMGDGPCDERYVNCAGIIDPYVFGTATADKTGYAEVEVEVLDTEAPEPVYFAAQVRDAAIDVGIWTDPIVRSISVPPAFAAVSFVAVSNAAGIDVFTTGNTHTGGLAWPDYNGDLLPDLIIGNGSGFPHRVFRNNGDGTFTSEPSLLAKPSIELEDAQPAFADIENDGDVDVLFVVDSPTPMDSELVQPREGGPNLLFVNQGDGTFVEDALARGVVDPRGWRNIGAAWADFDGDGFVDLYLATWAMNQSGSDRFGRLLMNDGTGHFVDSGEALGYGRDVLTLLAADTDVDGWSELFLGHVNKIVGYVGTNPLSDDVFYDNVGGELVDVTGDSPGLGDDDWASMGIDVGDIDNDGDFDYYQTDRFLTDDPLPRGNTFYLNNGGDRWGDNSCDVAKICTGYAGWPTGFADFDSDGWIDLWVGTGKNYAPDFLFINDHDGTFTSHAVPYFVNNATRGGGQADYDGDGDVDVAMWNFGDQSRLFKNTTDNDHHWVELKLIGQTANREAIGAVVALSNGGPSQLRRVSGGDSAHSQSESILHFGLAERTEAADLEITWPGGSKQVVTGVPIDRLVLIDQLAGVVAEQMIDASATYSAASGMLTVAMRTNYGGRSALTTPFGDLAWNPDTLRFEGTFATAPGPASVDVANLYGGSFDVPVSPAP
jgi:enediyne biosynthesis protein E4